MCPIYGPWLLGTQSSGHTSTFLWLTPLFSHIGLLWWKCALFLDPCLQGGNYVSPLGQRQLFLHTRLWNTSLEWHWHRMLPTTVPQQQQQLVPQGRAGWGAKVDSNVSMFYILFLVASQTLNIKITHFIMENFSIYESTEQCVCIVWIHNNHQLSRQGLTLPTSRCLTVNNPDVLCNPAGLWCKSVLAGRVLYSKVGWSIFVPFPQAWGLVRHSLVKDALLDLCSS